MTAESEPSINQGMLPVPQRKLVVIPHGVSPGEKPRKFAVSIDASDIKYGGVRVPFDLFKYYLEANRVAQSLGVPFKVALEGVNRVVAKFGLNRAENVLDPSKKKSHAERRYLENIVALEKIRAAISDAAAEVIGLDRYQGTESTLKKIGGDQKFRDYILHELHRMVDGIQGSDQHFLPDELPMSAQVVQCFESYVGFQSAISLALPRSKRGGNGRAPLTEDELRREILYPAIEGLQALHYVKDEDARFITARGGDFPSSGARNHTTAEHLREAIVTRLKIDILLRDEWQVLPNFDGMSFEVGDSRPSRPREPYYDDVSEKHQKILRVPGHPWGEHFIRRFMRDVVTGGLFKGQPIEVIKGVVNPVVRQWITHEMSQGQRDPLQQLYKQHHRGDRYTEIQDSFERWLSEPDKSPVIPDACGVIDFELVPREIALKIGRRAQKILSKHAA